MLRPYIRFGVYPRHCEPTRRCPTPAPRAPPAAPLPGCGAGCRSRCPRACGCDRRARHPGGCARGRGAAAGRARRRELLPAVPAGTGPGRCRSHAPRAAGRPVRAATHRDRAAASRPPARYPAAPRGAGVRWHGWCYGSEGGWRPGDAGPVWGRGGGGGGPWNGRRRRLHCSRRAADGDSSAAGAGARLSGRPYPAGVVLGGGRRTRHSRGSGPPDRRRGLQPGVPTTHDGVPVLPGAHAGRTDPGRRRHRPPAHRQLTRPAPWAGSKESQLTMLIALVLGLSVLALVVAWGLRGYVLRQDTGTPEMRKISDAIQEGAEAFLRRQYRTIGLLSVALGALIYVLYAFFRNPHPGEPAAGTLALTTTLSFLFGALCSGVAGIVGMYVAVRSNIRTASAARSSLNKALQIALRGGAVSGLFVVAMSLFGVGLLYTILEAMHFEPTKIPLMIVGYGFGASFVALFAQLGGGIYTKAADVGADLVGSTAAENIGAMILGSGLALANPGVFSPTQVVGLMLFPLVARAFGLVASIIGVLLVKAREDEDPMHALNRGYMWTAVLAAAGFVGGTYWLLNPAGHPAAWWHFALCGVIGIATSIAFVYITQYYTEYRYRPVKSIAAASVTGPATNIIAGFAVALECTALPTFTISAAIIASYKLGVSSGLAHSGLFGTAVATMGMLGTAAYILAMDTFGPITDNAGGIIEMSHQPEDIRRRTDRLDAVGNTTKALTKGYAIGSAALAAFLLFSAYLDEVAALGSPLAAVDISKPEVFVGGLFGAMLVFWFSALAISAVTKAAVSVIQEVRRQFKADPGILKGTSRPDYGRAVDIVTVGALKAMVAPGLLAVGMPIAVGLVFKLLFHVGAETVASFLMVGTIAGILMATLLNNGGGAWDNAKKFIETGEYGGKGSLPHKAAVVGDTVGDPFKDTAGPSLHVLIKLLSTVTLVLAPLFV